MLWLLQALLLMAAAAGQPAHPRLTFRKGGSFKLLQATDLHLGEWEADEGTHKVLRTALEAEKPDFVVFSGDMVSGFAFPAADLAARLARLGGGPSWYQQQWQRLIAPLHAAGIPYASILGNHDAEGDLSRRQIIQMDIGTGGQLSLTQQGPRHLTGASNYWLDIHDPQGAQVAARIWFLDSMNRGCGQQASGWGCVAADTVEWVQQQAAQLPRVPSLAYIHIPIPQMTAAWNRGPVNGSKGELVGCPVKDTGFFQAAKQLGIHAVYSGHDHHNDWAGSLEGVRLAYGRKTGYGSYGPAGLMHGARVVELQLGQDTADSATWIRQEDGSQLFQAEAQEPRAFVQEACPLNEGSCDRHLGARACIYLRSMRNTTTLLAVLAGVATAFAATVWACVVLAGSVRQHRRLRGWARVRQTDKFATPPDMTIVTAL